MINIREQYARAWVERGEGAGCVGVSIGLEYLEDDDVPSLTQVLDTLGAGALSLYGRKPDPHPYVVRFVEKAIKEAYPDRAYFIETERAGQGVQVFQPYGYPRVKREAF